MDRENSSFWHSLTGHQNLYRVPPIIHSFIMKFRLLVEFMTQAKGKFKKCKLSIFQPPSNWGEGEK